MTLCIIHMTYIMLNCIVKKEKAVHVQHKEQSNKESVENPVYAGRGNCMYTHMRIYSARLLLWYYKSVTSENMNTQIQAGVIVTVCKFLCHMSIIIISVKNKGKHKEQANEECQVKSGKLYVSVCCAYNSK